MVVDFGNWFCFCWWWRDEWVREPVWWSGKGQDATSDDMHHAHFRIGRLLCAGWDWELGLGATASDWRCFPWRERLIRLTARLVFVTGSQQVCAYVFLESFYNSSVTSHIQYWILFYDTITLKIKISDS